jgi:hypothetical protein
LEGQTEPEFYRSRSAASISRSSTGEFVLLVLLRDLVRRTPVAGQRAVDYFSKLSS